MKLISTEEAAKMLGMRVVSVTGLVRKGELTSFRKGSKGRHTLSLEEVEKLQEKILKPWKRDVWM